ncbi:MAG: sigma-54 interaction domain-containing protein [Candidatus Saccharicenans sp.]
MGKVLDMSKPELLVRMFEVIGEALSLDFFLLVAFDYRQHPFFKQQKGIRPEIGEEQRNNLIKKALARQRVVCETFNHGRGVLAGCFPYVDRDKLYGYAYFEKKAAEHGPDENELEILSSAFPAVRIISRSCHLPEGVKISAPSEQLEFLGLSQSFRTIKQMVQKVRNVNSPVLITGESGTGKELIARLIHHSGQRRQGEYVAVNCSAIPDSLLESELFGYVKGAFTGALRDRPGLLEEADGGTFFLDEVADLSLPLQAKLLRVLQEKEIRRIGENRNRRLDVRFVSATNKNLEHEVQLGRFRQDLYFRLKVISIEIPPLRQRPEDILVLINHFLDQYCQELGRSRCFFSPEALELMLKYEWPGNVRELQNEIQRALVLAGDRLVIEPEFLSPAIQKATEGQLRNSWDYYQARAEFEKKFLGEALRYFNYHRARTAAAIGLTRQGLFRLLKKYGLDRLRN